MFRKLMPVFDAGVVFKVILNDGLPCGIPLIARTSACLYDVIEGVSSIHISYKENTMSISEIHILDYDGLCWSVWASCGHSLRW